MKLNMEKLEVQNTRFVLKKLYLLLTCKLQRNLFYTHISCIYSIRVYARGTLLYRILLCKLNRATSRRLSYHSGEMIDKGVVTGVWQVAAVISTSAVQRVIQNSGLLYAHREFESQPAATSEKAESH